MAGSMYFVAIVAIGAILAAATGTIFLLVPAVMIALAVVLVPLAFGALRSTTPIGEGSEPHGVPSTSEASYEPVQEPKVG
jgi:hypothetical protein